MALPASFGTITVTGKYIDFLGAAAAGTVTFTPPPSVFLKATDVDVMIVPKAVQVTLDSEGAFSVSLPVTDDPDVVPAFTYAVQEVIGTLRRSYNVEIPSSLLPGPVDLSDLAPTGSVTVGTTALTKTVADTLYAPIDGGGLTSVASTDITDASATGRSLITAADAAAARTAIGAGTSSLALGTTSSTAKAGDYQPTAANISDATTVGKAVLTAADAAAGRTAIGAGTSNLALGSTGSTAAAGNHSHALNDLTDVDTAANPPDVGDVLAFDGTNFVPSVSPSNTDAASLTSGIMSIERLPLGSVVTVDYNKAVYGAANAWPASRPTARTDLVIRWSGPTDPGSIAIAGDVIDLTG